MTLSKTSTALDAALTVPCPTCYVKAGQPCRSRHAISLHQSRRAALADLSRQAASLVAAEQQKPARPARRVLAEVVGRTGAENVIPDDDGCGPPWD